MNYVILDTRWGAFGFVVVEDRLIATFLPQCGASLHKVIKSRWPDAVERRSLLPRFQKRIRDYFDGKRVAFDVDVDVSAQSPFRQTVLEVCRRIPYGKTASYADLARAVGRPGAARAVGSTMAHNPLPLVIPCHRVLSSDGSIGGFSSPHGIEEKKRLLRLEGTGLSTDGTGRVMRPHAAVKQGKSWARVSAGVA